MKEIVLEKLYFETKEVGVDGLAGVHEAPKNSRQRLGMEKIKRVNEVVGEVAELTDRYFRVEEVGDGCSNVQEYGEDGLTVSDHQRPGYSATFLELSSDILDQLESVGV